MFLQASVCPQLGWGCLPQCMLGYHPPPRADTYSPDQTPPEQTPSQEQTPPEQTHTPRTRHPPQADTPPEQTPPGADTPLEKTPPRSRHPPKQTPPPPEQTPPPDQTPPRADTPQEQTPPQTRHPPRPDTPSPEIRPLLQTVRILLECILVAVKFSPFSTLSLQLDYYKKQLKGPLIFTLKKQDKLSGKRVIYQGIAREF